MGLLEKRAVKEYQDNKYNALVSEINQIAGYEIEFDVKWDTLAVNDHSHLFEEGFTKVYFMPVINALKEITKDDLGKEALKETLKKIIVKNEEGISYYESAYSYSEKVLTIDHEPFTNMDNVSDRSNFLVEFLSSKM